MDDDGLIAGFDGKKYLSIETYRKSGKAVRTPVWFVESNAALYIRTATSAGKYKRIRNNPSVRIAPCDMRGNVKGEWVQAKAARATEAEAAEAYRLLRKKYGLLYSLTTAFMRKDFAVLKVTTGVASDRAE
jgi:PPOX class probable F420-dependent enzyme